MLAALPRSTRLTAPQRLTLVSYNLLAPIYVRPIDERTGTVQAFAAFAWAEPAEDRLAWDARRPRLLAELKASEADVICLQEVQFEPVPAAASDASNTQAEEEYALPQWLTLDGYVACIPSQRPLREMALRNERVLRARNPVGNALLYRADRLEELDEPGVGPDKEGQGSTTRVGVCVRGRRGSGLERLGKCAVFSVHLDATSEEKRVKALTRCVELARSSYGTRSVVLGGDFNTELLRGSCTAALAAAGLEADDPIAGQGDGGASASMTAAPPPSEVELERECISALRLDAEDESTEEADEAGGAAGAAAVSVSDPVAAEEKRPSAAQMAAWRELHASASAVPSQTRIALRRVPTGGTRAAYAPGQSDGACEAWRLDHVLYTPRSLHLAAYWQTLEALPAASAAGLPTREWPSDHLCIGASFELIEVPALAAAAREALLTRMRTLLDEQAAERTSLSTALAEETMLRSRRERERALKGSQREVRQALFDALSELERDALEEAKLDLVASE